MDTLNVQREELFSRGSSRVHDVDDDYGPSRLRKAVKLSNASGLNGMMKHRRVTVERLEKFIQTGQFEDVNLRSFLWKHKDANAVTLSVHAVKDLARVPFATAVKGEYKATKVGDKFGPSWSTHWFRIHLKIPPKWAGEAVVLVFDPDCEGLVFSEDGIPLQGLTGTDGCERNVEFVVVEKAKGGEEVKLYIEIACNTLFGNGRNGGGINPPDPSKQFTLKAAELRVPHREAFDLLWDFEVILGMAKDLPEDSQLASDALFVANQIVNILRRNEPASLGKALGVSLEYFQTRQIGERSNRYKTSHVVTAVGNCHIDTAWLWNYAETKRKVARSFATQIRHMANNPDYIFTASQAQQFAWLEEGYPELFKRVVEKAGGGPYARVTVDSDGSVLKAKGKKQFVPVGGTWVEMDCNIPSGEGLCRQFLYGQRYFEEKFGERSKVFWLPDTFGYAAQLPQIIKKSGLEYFFTQKLSWNLINKFPHTTFRWIGLDGTPILTHFSPADTYVAQGTVREIAMCLKNNKDKEYTNRSLLLFGNGDGGGGPLRPMIERLTRLRGVEGMPATVKFGDPNTFFEELERSCMDVPHWQGELYFELHRGTYTTQAETKKYNRLTEYLLRDVEFLWTFANLSGANGIQAATMKSLKAEIERLWKLVLLNQFHDVLPGSSIECVYEDAKQYYLEVVNIGTKLRNEALQKLLAAPKLNSPPRSQKTVTILNSTSWEIPAEVLELKQTFDRSVSWHQLSASGKPLYLVKNVLPMAVQTFDLTQADMLANEVKVSSTLVKTTIENDWITLVLNEHGHIASFFDKKQRRELIAEGMRANVFKLFEDIPLYWDAWDVEVYHLEKGWEASTEESSVVVEETGPLRAVVLVKHKLSTTSCLSQRIIVTAAGPRVDFDTTVEWNENRVVMKVEFPLEISSSFATYETQFGYILRPTHYNNSWDMAKFEVCGHKFADLSEHGYGVALLNDSKYGYSCKGGVLRLTLLRAAKAPDERADIGTHRFKYALYPHSGVFHESDVVRAGYQFNVPPSEIVLSTAMSAATTKQLIKILNADGTAGAGHVVIDTVKLAEDPRPVIQTADGKPVADIVVRLYEAYGGRGEFILETGFPLLRVNRANILEELEEDVLFEGSGRVRIRVKPFEVITLRALCICVRG
ncbi:galactose mutarotase-like domain-containing protein [Zopfochytrium polystomum]|nr:galactose mutarotase-like domain-containing protein [Zopfochytrium polystomum]